MLVSQVAQFLVSVIAIAVLARLLTPRDFGLFAMVGILLGLAGTITNFGFPTAMVHFSELSQSQATRLFWFNLKLTGLLTLALLLLAFPLAQFFDEPSLASITGVLAIGTFLRGAVALNQGLLLRQMRFGQIAAIGLASLVSGFLVGFVLALSGARFWALVMQQFTQYAIEAALIWFTCSWRPTASAPREDEERFSLSSVLIYGRQTTLARLLGEIGNQADRLLLGRFLGADVLGLYQNAARWSSAPFLLLYPPVKRLAVAGFGRFQDDIDQYREYARYIVLAVLTAALPMVALLFIEARSVILLLLGQGWVAAVPIFQVLVLMALVETFNRVTRWIYLSEGRTDRRLYWTLLSTPLLVVGMVAGLRWGAIGVAIGFCVAKFLLAYPGLVYCLQTSPLRQGDLLHPAIRPSMATLGACLVPLSSEQWIPDHVLSPVALLISAAAFTLTYCIIWLAIPGGREMAALVMAALKDQRGKELQHSA